MLLPYHWGKRKEMDDLHSIAYNGCCTASNSVAWEFHNLGFFNTDMPHFMHNSAQEMDGCTPPSDLSSSIDSDYSTGYLQDALFEFSSKRRRLLLFSDDQNLSGYPNDQSCWKENFGDIYPQSFGYLNQLTEMDCITGTNVDNSGSVSKGSSEKEINVMRETRRSETEGSTPLDSSSSSQTKYSINNNTSDPVSPTLHALDSLPSSAGGGEKKRKKIITRVVYPFAVVKPGGIEGDVTLNDINKRILMPPTRPVRHPVGDFACRPIASPHGPGLSGKAVVALTRIQTHGRGTITIIRTKG